MTNFRNAKIFFSFYDQKVIDMQFLSALNEQFILEKGNCVMKYRAMVK